MGDILIYAGLAFVGGIILNVMPCVLPVLTMKVFHVINHAQEDPKVNRMHGIAYSLGILATFWALAGVIIGLRYGGKSMGWGMQFQSPWFVGILTALIFAFGLNALGVFELTVGMSSVEDKGGYTGSFVNGIVASIMATPCSAPFLGTAAAYALGTGAAWWQTASMFTFIGLGLGFPFLLISFIPAIGAKLPRPGAWMETVKQVMGFTLMAATIWLLGVLQAQISNDGVQLFIAFLLVLAISLWAMHKFGGLEHSNTRRRVVQVIGFGSAIAGGYFLLDFTPRPKTIDKVVMSCPGDSPVPAEEHKAVVDGKINWALFDPKRVEAELARNRPVFVDFTAEWCANCKTNEKVFIETEVIHKSLTETNVLPMKADFTNEDEEIEKWMQALGRSGIPIYVVYYPTCKTLPNCPEGTFDLLPEASPKLDALVDASLRTAAKDYPKDKYTAPPAASPAAPPPCEKTADASEKPAEGEGTKTAAATP